jgi:hypothetical protein
MQTARGPGLKDTLWFLNWTKDKEMLKQKNTETGREMRLIDESHLARRTLRNHFLLNRKRFAPRRSSRI